MMYFASVTDMKEAENILLHLKVWKYNVQTESNMSPGQPGCVYILYDE